MPPQVLLQVVQQLSEPGEARGAPAPQRQEAHRQQGQEGCAGGQEGRSHDEGQVGRDEKWSKWTKAVENSS